MASLDTTILIKLDRETRDFIKAGRRNSAADVALLEQVKSKLAEATAILDNLGLAEQAEEEMVETDGEAEEVKTAPANVPSPDDTKALALDRQVSAVEQAVRKLNSGDFYERKPYEQWVEMAACYDGHCIVREGLSHYKVTYELGDTCCTLCDRAGWEKVEPSWSVVTATEKAVDLDSSLLVKSLGDGKLGHYGVLWGSTKQRDLYGEWFAKDTAEMDVIFKAIGKVPLLYHHAMDGALKTSVVGVVEKMVPDEIGLWMESQLNMANSYSSALLQMVERKALGTSTGTLPGGRAVEKATGKITRWPIAEASLTPTPAEPRMRQSLPVAVLKSYFADAGLALPDELTQDTGTEEVRSVDELDLERERLSLLALTLN